MNEGELKSCIEDYLQYGMNQGKWYADRLNSGEVLVKKGEKVYKVQLCREGTADFMVLKNNGRFDAPNKFYCIPIFLELKGEKGKTSPAQNAFKILVEAQGAEYFVIRSIEELENILEGDKKPPIRFPSQNPY